MSESYRPIGEVVDIQSGFAFPSNCFEDNGIPIIRMSNLKQGALDFENVKYVSEKWLKKFPQFQLYQNDFLLGMSGSLSNNAFVSSDYLPALLNQRVARIKLNTNTADYSYICYWLSSYSYEKYADIVGEGAAQKNISAQQISNFKVRLPDKTEQHKIATILSTIDESIEHTEALIAKYQHIKAGMMNDLFTRGVLPDGTLRLTRDEAPELYHETPIGWIPKEWGYDYLLNLLAPVSNNMRSGPFGSALLKSELSEDGIPFLGIDNIHVEKFVSEFKRFVSTRKYAELNRYSTRPNDVVITIMGTVGRCCVIPQELEFGLSSKHLWTMTFNQNKVLSTLVCWQLNYASWVQTWFRRETQGGIMDAIQSKTLKTLILPLPDDKEQIRILDRYLAMNKKIDTEIKNLEKLKKQKSGLMHDLLTGEVRVKIAQE